MIIPKTKAAWKRLQPSNLRDALRLCKEYARQINRLTVPTIAEPIDETEDTLYKWLSTGKMPATKIPAYEHVCGIDYVTQYLAFRSHKLMIDIPSGAAATELEINELQSIISEGMTLLIRFYKDGENQQKTIEGLTQIMGGMAFHKENIQRQPELPLFEDVEQ